MKSDLTTTVDNTTELRKVLEKIEDEIHNSYLKDADKVTEFILLNKILNEILSKSKIEDYFESPADFQYFLNKFSKNVIKNILDQRVIYGDNGDEVAYQSLLLYLQIFNKFKTKSEYANLWESIKEIFEKSRYFYNNLYSKHSKITTEMNERRLMSLEKFNDTFLFKKSKTAETKLIFKENDMVEIQIPNIVSNSYGEKKVWTRGIVSKVGISCFWVTIAEESEPVILSFDSTDYRTVGTMTPDYDWKNSLNECNLT